ncbi:unnamed protein product [Adineta ricciae]|uniref:Uncharacterized protein n=1 Tax=Adineta ricciae TaxID=249248 RepID=A0A815UNG5_ADIRI|nr:unnamed protein product [Adineta ricciae]
MESIHGDHMTNLHEYLMRNYSKYVRPVQNNSDILNVKFGLKLIQIDDVNAKSQIIQTHVYALHEWQDHSLIWSPEDFGGIDYIHISNDLIWKPDLVLYNNADGDFHITSKAKVFIRYDGTVNWNPPMIYKSYCAINIRHYPFDEQNCTLKFGTWTYSGSLVNLQFINNDQLSVIERGWDLEDYMPSIEWEILDLTAFRHEIIYACCAEIYLDLTFTCVMQRKSLFYTINLILPCMNISILCVLVFLLPSDSRKKITLSISILVALLVFYLLLIESIPPTSFVMPLLGKYLLFTLVLVNLSIITTIITLNVHFSRRPTSSVPLLLRNILLVYLPKLLLMRRPSNLSELGDTTRKSSSMHENERQTRRSLRMTASRVASIAQQMNNLKNEKEIVEEWRFIALTFDRLFLIIFTSVTLICTLESFRHIPSLYKPASSINPICYTYYPPIDDVQWLRICNTI